MIESALAFHDDSCRFFSFRCDSVDEGLCHEGEVFSAEDGFKKSLGGGLSSAVVDCSFCGRESFLLVGVVVRRILRHQRHDLRQRKPQRLRYMGKTRR